MHEAIFTYMSPSWKHVVIMNDAIHMHTSSSPWVLTLVSLRSDEVNLTKIARGYFVVVYCTVYDAGDWTNYVYTPSFTL